MKKGIQLASIFCLLSLVIIVGLKTTFDGYYGFYYEDGKYQKPFAYTLSESIIQCKPVSFFMMHTGFDTGYGFFAPNVASDFVLVFDIRDSAGQVISQSIMPQFRQKESAVRYTSLYNMFLDKIGKESGKDDNKYNQYLDVVVQQIAKNVKDHHTGASFVEASLYLYDYPGIDKYNQGDKKEKAFLIGKYKI